jgi:crotonobetainyl-CoA:carnitine CoA-transferase CaiB-like acyl-CoA transferase
MSEMPFAGLKVLDLAWVVAGPAIGRVLADYGATVVRVESSTRVEIARSVGPFPGGEFDPQRSALYDNCNSGKLGVAVDLSRDEARQIIRDLTSWADVVIESFVPGQLERWGLGPDSLRSINPGVVGLSTSLMGRTGPYASLAGFGNIGAAMAGFQGLVGHVGSQPIGPFGPYTDYVGPRFGLVALLAALDHRRRTGEGCWLDVSQAEAGIQFLAAEVAAAAGSGRRLALAGNRDPRFAPNGVFHCKGEDEWIALTVRNDQDWERLARMIGGQVLDPAFATLAGRQAEEDRLEAIVGNWTLGQAAQDLEGRLQGAGVPAHVAARSEDLVADPHLAKRGHWVRLPHPLGGESVVEASRYQLSETPAAYIRTAPHWGRDVREVLIGFLGYDEARLKALDAAGVLR